MKSHVSRYWDDLRSSFWFLPSLMATGAVLLAFAGVALDRSISDEWLRTHRWAYTGGAEGASAVLGTIAGSMITIAGVVFSLTLVALSLASSQFGPRLLRNFMRDTTNQVVLGTFVGTFLYCLLVLRTIRRADEVAFVPHLSVSLGVLFAIASLGVLIYFIHHVSVSIQADEIVGRVGDELLLGIDRLYPAQDGDRPAPERADIELPATFDREAVRVPAPDDGYLQLLDLESLVALGAEIDVVIRVARRPGQYAVQGSPLAMVWPPDRASERVRERVAAAFVLGPRRTPAQDIEFSVDQLVEIAARAMSPGVNDPFTAMTCVDRLGSAMCRLVRRELPSPYRWDGAHRLRVVTQPVTFPELADAAFNQIRQYARSSAAVTMRLLDTLAGIAGVARRLEHRAALLRHAEMIVRGAREALPEIQDRHDVEARFEVASRALRGA
jgi:uncharacterized membrane protein